MLIYKWLYRETWSFYEKTRAVNFSVWYVLWVLHECKPWFGCAFNWSSIFLFFNHWGFVCVSFVPSFCLWDVCVSLNFLCVQHLSCSSFIFTCLCLRFCRCVCSSVWVLISVCYCADCLWSVLTRRRYHWSVTTRRKRDGGVGRSRRNWRKKKSN